MGSIISFTVPTVYVDRLKGIDSKEDINEWCIYLHSYEIIFMYKDEYCECH